MNTQNEFGKDAGRYVYRTHEVGAPPGSQVSVTDLQTGETEVLAQRADWERFDGIVWTPWGTILAAEETTRAAVRDPQGPEAGLVYEYFVDPDDPSELDSRGGSSIVLNAKTGDYRETRHFGLLPHENIVPVKGLAGAHMLTTEDGDTAPAGTPDDPGVNESQLYSYLAPTFGGAISGDQGSLYAWKANDGQGVDNDPSTDDIEQDETIEGRFVRISQEDNTDAEALEAAAQSKNAFDFVRLEDAAVSKTRANVLYIADTGTLGSESDHGRLYKFEIDKDEPRNASLTLVIDGDDSPDPVQMTNPDNLDISEESVVIQEDRNSEYRQSDDPGNGYGRVLVYDLESKKLRAVPRVNTPSNLDPGTWESSGVINASRLLGEDQWLLDVQAHSLPEEQPGPSLEPDSSVGEDGQLLRIKIPNS